MKKTFELSTNTMILVRDLAEHLKLRDEFSEFVETDYELDAILWCIRVQHYRLQLQGAFGEKESSKD